MYVCPPDWEPRQPLDFYRTRPDTHPLPRTAEDSVITGYAESATVGGWLPAWTNITLGTSTDVLNDNATTVITAVAANGSYRDDVLSTTNTRTLAAQILVPFKTSVIFSVANATTSITLPSIPVVAGTYTLKTNHGRILKSGVIPAGSATLALTTAAVTIKDDNVTFSGQYGI